MGKVFDHIVPTVREFIKQQHLFFVSTAPLSGEGHINLSPKGLDGFRILDDQTVAYLDLVGSGNETSAHLLENGRITIMFCSFDKVPNILRLYGSGTVVLPTDPEWETVSAHFTLFPGVRQIILVRVTRVQNSCGYGVPLLDFRSERSTLTDWANHKGDAALKKYMKENNERSLDGLLTHIGKSTGE